MRKRKVVPKSEHRVHVQFGCPDKELLNEFIQGNLIIAILMLGPVDSVIASKHQIEKYILNYCLHQRKFKGVADRLSFTAIQKNYATIAQKESWVAQFTKNWNQPHIAWTPPAGINRGLINDKASVSK